MAYRGYPDRGRPGRDGAVAEDGRTGAPAQGRQGPGSAPEVAVERGAVHVAQALAAEVAGQVARAVGRVEPTVYRVTGPEEAAVAGRDLAGRRQPLGAAERLALPVDV